MLYTVVKEVEYCVCVNCSRWNGLDGFAAFS